MGVSKVEFGGETVVDLTNDTVKDNNLLKGATAHGADGEPVEGGVTVAPLTTSLAVNEEGVSALDAAAGKTLNDKGEQIAFYKNEEDGMWHFRDWNGADTGLPFNKGYNLKTDYVYLSSGGEAHISVPGKVFAALLRADGAYYVSCAWWDGTKIINPPSYYHVSPKILDDRETVTIGNSQSRAIGVTYAIFYE